MFYDVNIACYPHHLTTSVGRWASIGSPRAGVARAGIESLEAFDGAIERMNVSKRSSYKALFLVCLVGHGF